MRITLFTALALGPLAFGSDRPESPTITVGKPGEPGKPTEVRGMPGRAVRLEATAAGSVEWFTIEDADLVPLGDGKTALFVAAKPGKYLVLAVTAKGDLPSRPSAVVVVVGTPDPEPIIPPPKPVDPLLAKLRAAFAADVEIAGTVKADALKLLAELYRQAVLFAAVETLTTTADLAGRLVSLSKTLLPAGALPGVRGVIAEVLSDAFPDDVALTPESRKSAAELFLKLAVALAAAGK